MGKHEAADEQTVTLEPDVDLEARVTKLLERIAPTVIRAKRGPSVESRTYARVQKDRAEEAERVDLEKRASSGDAEAIEKLGATIQRDGTQRSNVLPSNDDVHTMFTMAGALFPPYDPEVLTTLYEHSNALRSNVESYETNIDSFGYQLEPVIDFTKGDAKEKVGDAMYIERMRERERLGTAAVAQAAYPADEEINARIVEIKALARLEHAKLTNFFDFCCSETDFVELRRRMRCDEEVTGNAYWEVLRNNAGEITQFVYVPAYSVRLIPIEHRHHETPTKQKITAISYETVMQHRRFRRYVQVVLDRIVHFKEFGDPRVISRKSGQEYPSLEALKLADAHDGPATEILHFRVHSPRSPYGIPRWIGNLLAVLGSRASEEVNFLYFDNKAVPPLAILVSGGRIADASAKKIESYVRDNLRGKENFHRILIVEAEAGPNASPAEQGRVRIALEPLRDAQQDDALFQNYDERNIDKIGMSFRLPRLLRGDVRDFNRATAEAALQFAETQVFQPERERFDALINRRVLADLGIRFWRFVSNSPVNRDPKDLTEMADTFSKNGTITINEARKLAADVFNIEFPPVDPSWGDLPLPLVVAGVGGDSGAGLPAPGTPSAPAKVAAADGEDAEPLASASSSKPLSPEEQRLRAVAAGIIRLRQGLETAQKKAWADHFSEVVKTAKDEGTVVLAIPKAEIDSWFEPEAR